MKYAIRFLSVAAFFLMIEQTSFFITRHAAKNMLADKEQKVIFGGRLGEYKYYDMDAVIDSALTMCEHELGQ